MSGLSPLRLALKDHDRQTFKRLLEDGADANAIASDNLSVMHLSALEEESLWLELALQHSGDPNLVNTHASQFQRGTPAYFAITAGRLRNVELLVNAGADIDSMESGQSLLVEAFLSSNYDIVVYLLNAGADYTLSPKDKASSLIDWVNHRKPELIEDQHARDEIEKVRQWLRDKGVALED